MKTITHLLQIINTYGYMTPLLIWANKRNVWMKTTAEELLIHLLLVDGDPVCGSKPLVTLYIIDTIFQISKTFCEVNLKEITKKISQIRTEM